MDDENKKTQNQPQNVGSVVREIERPVSDYATEKAPQVSEELKSIGVESSSDNLQVDKSNEQIGVKASAETVAVPATPNSSLVLPKTTELKKEAKSLKTVDGRLWEIEKELREIDKKQRKAA